MKKIILLLFINLSFLTLANDFNGVWKAKAEDRYYYFKIENNNVNLIVLLDGDYFFELKSRGKIIEKINSKKQVHGGIFLVNECSLVLYGKLTASRSSSPFLVKLDI